MTAINSVAPGLIAGNAVVLKHATQTLLVGERMVWAFEEAGLPESLFANLFPDHQTTEELIGGGHFDFINFTGSVGAGRRLEHAAAGNFTGMALAAGAKAMIDPALFPEDDGGTYLAPQILTNVGHTMRVMRDESFGPVVGIMKVESDEEAVSLMNDSSFGLTASLWTGDSDRAARLGA